MAPRIQYVRTTDGVNLACFSEGEGLPFVMPPPAAPWSDARLEWEIPEWRAWYERVTPSLRVIRYDGRGTGMSDRDADDVSLDAAVRDLEAVVDGLGLERFALFGCHVASNYAIAYAARHPERVSHLVLWHGFSNYAELRSATPARNEAIERLREVDYELFTETLVRTLFGWAEGEPAHRMAVYLQESASPEFAARSWDVNADCDVTALLPLVQSPTLVMQRREFPSFGLDVARRLASQIPGARIALLEGSSLAPFLGDADAALDAMFDFLGVAAPADDSHAHGAAAHQHDAAGAFRTILFSDVENSTGLIDRLGDAAGRERLRAHERIVREALRAHGGSEVKTMGDGFMAAFGSATRAIECAIAVQRAMAEHNHGHADPVEVRVGLNAGEPIAEADDFFGTSVNVAARIAAKACAGEVLASDVVRQLVAGKGFLFADRGDTVLRGFEDPVRIYEVRWRE